MQTVISNPLLILRGGMRLQHTVLKLPQIMIALLITVSTTHITLTVVAMWHTQNCRLHVWNHKPSWLNPGCRLMASSTGCWIVRQYQCCNAKQSNGYICT